MHRIRFEFFVKLSDSSDPMQNYFWESDEVLAYLLHVFTAIYFFHNILTFILDIMQTIIKQYIFLSFRPYDAIISIKELFTISLYKTFTQ